MFLRPVPADFPLIRLVLLSHKVRMPIDPGDKLHFIGRILRDDRLSSLAKNVAAYLVECKNSKTGLCFPRIETVADDLDRSRRAINNAITELKEAGHLVSRRRRGSALYYFPALPGDDEMQ